MAARTEILIVDDEPDLLDLLKFELESVGYTVRTAENGIEALECLKTFNPALIITDLGMPKMDGLTFLKTLRNGDGPRPLVIVTSGYSEKLESERENLNIGAIIGKPYLMEEISALVAKLVVIKAG